MSFFFLASYIALWILVLTLIVAVFLLFHHFGQEYLKTAEARENQGPQIGATVEPISMLDYFGRAILIPAEVGGVIVEFASTDCEPCNIVKPVLEALLDDYENISLLSFVAGDDASIAEWANSSPQTAQYIPDRDRTLMNEWNVIVTPFFVAIDMEGTVVDKGMINDSDHLAEMFTKAGAVRREALMLAASGLEV